LCVTGKKVLRQDGMATGRGSKLSAEPNQFGLQHFRVDARLSAKARAYANEFEMAMGLKAKLNVRREWGSVEFLEKWGSDF